jgi:hypothetical protein
MNSGQVWVNGQRSTVNGDARLRYDIAQAVFAWFSGTMLHAGRRIEMAESPCCKKSRVDPLRPEWEVVCFSVQCVANHLYSIDTGYTVFLGGRLGRASVEQFWRQDGTHRTGNGLCFTHPPLFLIHPPLPHPGKQNRSGTSIRHFPSDVCPSPIILRCTSAARPGSTANAGSWECQNTDVQSSR